MAENIKSAAGKKNPLLIILQIKLHVLDALFKAAIINNFISTMKHIIACNVEGIQSMRIITQL